MNIMVIKMNLSHIKYIVEIEKTGSITKAASNLFMGQPNLSKAVRELENEIGTEIFRRTSKGVEPTAEGRKFIAKAKDVLSSVAELEDLYKAKSEPEKRLSVSYIFDFYIASAVLDFTEYAVGVSCRCRFSSSDNENILRDTADGISDIGIVRFPCDKNSHDYAPHDVAAYVLECEEIGRFAECAVMSEENPLAGKKVISREMLADYPRAGGADADICISDGGILAALKCAPMLYSLLSPVSQKEMKGSGLVFRRLSDPQNDFRDLIVYRKDAALSDEAEKFIETVRRKFNGE